MKNKKIKIIGLVLAAALYVVISASAFFLSAAAPSSPKSEYVICVDAGHGGIDKGAYGVKYNTPESEINLAISKLLAAKISKANLTPVMTRLDEEGLYGDTSPGFKRRDMRERKRIAEKASADLLVSIHCNISRDSSRRGAVIYFNKDDPVSVIMAENVAAELRKISALKGKVRLDDEIMYITNEIDVPAVIVECGFLSNALDEELLLSDAYKKQLADRIFNGVFKTLYDSI